MRWIPPRAELSTNNIRESIKTSSDHVQIENSLVANREENYVSLLRRCTRSRDIDAGKLIPAHMNNTFKKGRKSSTLNYTLFCMYAKCGNLAEMRSAFDAIERPSVVAWTSLINEYVKNRDMVEEAVALYHRMIQEGVNPNHVTYLCVLKACAFLGLIHHGKYVHVNVSVNSSGSELVLGNALIDMYAKCGDVEMAQIEFNQMYDRTVVSWNSLISGYVKNHDYEHAFSLFLDMKQGGIEPDPVTFLSVLKMCASKKDLGHGKLTHSGILTAGFEEIAFIENALVDMYCKCECLEDAKRVFGRIKKPHVGAWNALISGCAELSFPEEAIKNFKEMKCETLELSRVTFLSVLKASSVLAALDLGCEIHELIKRNRLETDLFVASNLVDMYAKCGNLEEARKVFDKMSSRSLVTWNTLISGYALHGEAKEAFRLSWRMEKKERVDLNHVTLVGLLFACSHAGLVEEGYRCFETVCRGYDVQPLMEHYCCIVDVLGRAGCLDDAFYVIQNMPFEPNAAIWKAFLGACKTCYDIDLAKYVVDSLEPQDNATFVLLSNIFAAGSGWEDILGDSEV